MKRQSKMSDSKQVKMFVTLQGNRGTNGKITSVNLASAGMDRPETLHQDETCFEVKLNVPIAAFDPPAIEIKIDPMIPDEIKAEVESWISGE